MPKQSEEQLQNVAEATAGSGAGAPPPGWDVTTYANFKAANPTLEPTAEDTQRMLTAGTNPAPIAVSTLGTPQTPTPFAQPKITPVPDVPAVPEMTLTAPEQKAQDLGSEIERLNKNLIGESAFRTQQEGTQDIAGKTQTVNDLTNRLTSLKAEYDAVPLQLQQASEGRGITAGGLAPITAGKQRELAIESLGVGALLNAAQGNLTTALALVDRAVKAKFDPIREEIAAKTANYNIVLQSPNYSVAQKNRAQKQLDAENARQKALDKQEQAEKDKQKVAVDVASRGGSAIVLKQIQDAPDAVTAQEVATNAGFAPLPAASDTETVEVGGRKLLINSKTGQTIKDLGAVPAGGGTVSERNAATLQSYASAFVPGAKLPDGTPVLDQNGFINPDAWKAAIADYKGDRADFIKKYGYLLYATNYDDKGKEVGTGSGTYGVSPAYGLTTQEKKLITG